MRSLFTALALAVFAAASPLLAANNALIHVPQDGGLDTAIQNVTNNGVIEIAAGTYPTPANGFAIKNANARKSFTIRAAAGATVALDGGGTNSLVRITSNNGQLVIFDGITFQNGSTTDIVASGGVTLSHGNALFRNCAFVGNKAAMPANGGGAVGVLDSSSATFSNCSFRDNSSASTGGAMVVRTGAVAIVQGGEFLRNRVNLPGHQPNSAGGGIYLLNATLKVTGTNFDSNEAGFVGGAIYAIGTWDKGTDLQVTNATFRANQAVADPCCGGSDPTTGGAIHAEDLTNAKIQQSLFLLNRSDLGGAIDVYRAVFELDGSVMRGNQSTRANPAGRAGGAISALSPDFVDVSTANGAINRRPARLVINQSLIQGGSEVETVANTGACILASGDTARVYGGTGVPLDGSVADNRAQVVIHGSVFLDCDVNGTGGAIAANLTDLDLEDSMVLDSDARGNGSGGGGVSLLQESTAKIVRTTFARNSAGFWGGALLNIGSNFQVSDSRFYRNTVANGTFNQVDSHGAAILATPSTDPMRDVTGTVITSSFSDNQGLPIWDVVNGSGPANRVRYDANRFNPVVFGDHVYVDSRNMPSGANVDQLNFLMSPRGGNATNTRLFNPHEGALVIVPSVNSVGANAPLPGNANLAYAWSGNFAAINGTNLSQPDGLLEVGPGGYVLNVNGAAAAFATVTGTCTAGSTLCLAGNRFRAEVTWKAGNLGGAAQAVSLSGDTGYFWFSDPANVELMVKVLDGRPLNGSFWVFYGALSNLEYTLTLTDTVTGAVKTYTNPSGQFASVGDTTAFPSKAGTLPETTSSTLAAIDSFEETGGDQGAVTAAATACAAGATALCLSSSRFRVELAWNDGHGHSGAGQAVPLSGDTGYFWFTSSNNVEVIVKVLDARPFNNRFWVFYGALSNQEYTLTVTDTQTGFVKTYHNPLGKFGSVGDTSAIPGP
ncbi:MAG TPA: right-handed parallel beta-helix repeat-containing protein [Thermoanaerobaculia bacterium]|nr:right-handed parallel beta-helix repeat-containing protein [Thermoanaerobaculia bacterium]